MQDNIRISDADREQVTARLREHFAEGRLTSDELDERISTTLNAKTFGDLRGVMADLPEPGPLGPQQAPVPPAWTPGPPMYYRRGPRFLPVALLIFFAAMVLSGPGWAFFAFFKFALLAWLVLCIAGFVTAARFRRRVRHSAHYGGDGNQWRR
ncbi:MAG TPA: DUF1707 domain-containing protein [Streptosporangiaceae bacterium]|nr:DUF1707 domain-containing protein [Streptosporangiaceae bacterium]